MPKLLEGDSLETQDDLLHHWKWPCLSDLCLEKEGNIREEELNTNLCLSF